MVTKKSAKAGTGQWNRALANIALIDHGWRWDHFLMNNGELTSRVSWSLVPVCPFITNWPASNSHFIPFFWFILLFIFLQTSQNRFALLLSGNWSGLPDGPVAYPTVLHQPNEYWSGISQHFGRWPAKVALNDNFHTIGHWSHVSVNVCKGRPIREQAELRALYVKLLLTGILCSRHSHSG